MDLELIAALPGLLDAARATAEDALRRARAEPVGNPLADALADGDERGRGLLITGDNLAPLAALAIAVERGEHPPIDVAYLDPPYDSDADYRHEMVLDGSRVTRHAYSDRWPGGTAGYLGMVAARLMLVRASLAGTGLVAVHADWHAGHYLRVVLDAVFGRERFVNELIWRYGKMSHATRRFPRSHDAISVYAAGPRHFFAPVRVAPSEYRARFERRLDGNVLRYGAVAESRDRLIALRVRRRERELGRPLEPGDVLFDFDAERKVQDDVFTDIPIVKGNAAERTGYATQKPERLIERLLDAYCPPGGMVLDPFCGSGTTLAVAERTGRGWIGIDASPVAIEVATERLGALGAEPRRIGPS